MPFEPAGSNDPRLPSYASPPTQGRTPTPSVADTAVQKAMEQQAETQLKLAESLSALAAKLDGQGTDQSRMDDKCNGSEPTKLGMRLLSA